MLKWLAGHEVCVLQSQIQRNHPFCFSLSHFLVFQPAGPCGSSLQFKCPKWHPIPYILGKIRLQLNRMQCGPLFTPCSFLPALQLALYCQQHGLNGENDWFRGRYDRKGRVLAPQIDRQKNRFPHPKMVSGGVDGHGSIIWKFFNRGSWNDTHNVPPILL